MWPIKELLKSLNGDKQHTIQQQKLQVFTALGRFYISAQFFRGCFEHEL